MSTTTETTQTPTPQVPAVAAPATGTLPVATPEGTTTPKIDDTDLSSKFAALSRKEKALMAQQKKVKELTDKYGALDAINAKENPMAVLEKFGLSLDDLVQYSLKNGQPKTADDKILTVEEKLAKMEKEREAERQAGIQERNNKAVNDFKGKIRAHLDTDPAKFELIHAHKAYDKIFEVIAQYWDNQEDVEPNDRQHLPIEKAADLVENDLYEEAKKFLGVSKYKSLFLPQPPVEDTKKKATDTPTPQTEPTLTNKGPTPQVPRPGQVLPREDAIKMIAAKYASKL